MDIVGYGDVVKKSGGCVWLFCFYLPLWKLNEISMMETGEESIFTTRKIVLVIVGLFLLYISVNKCSTTRPAPVEDLRKSAYFIGQKFIDDHLVSPSSATYPLYTENSEDIKIDVKGKVCTIRSFVDGDNKLGVKNRMPYIIELEFSGDKWLCRTLLLDGVRY